MQPKELLVIDITKPEEQLLAEMKSKTRYNINLSQKRKVSVKVISNFQPCLPAGRFPISNKIPNSNDQNFEKYFKEFIRLVHLTAVRDKIVSHPDSYYRNMFETIPPEIIKLYAAEYKGKIIAANIMIFYNDTAVYLHGASDNEHRDVMAPYLLHWQAIKDAKRASFKSYDLGGVMIENIAGESLAKLEDSKWAGITRFKQGFSMVTKPVQYPGSWDIIINSPRYNIYRVTQKLKSLIK